MKSLIAASWLVALSCLLSFNAYGARSLTLDGLFPTNRVVKVSNKVKESDWDQLRYQTRDRGRIWERQFGPMESPFTYVDADVTIDGVTFSKVGIRKKGFIGSLSHTRPSLKVKLNHHKEGANLGGLTSLTFNNNKQDRGLLTQYMTYSVFNRVGSPAPRCAFAHVTVNGRNLGVYSHVETVRKPILKREFGSDQGTLYEGTAVDFDPGWEKSLELKTGDDAPGREKIIAITEALQGPGRYLVDANADARAWVPRSAGDQSGWTALDFDDSRWIKGKNGLGYESQRGYEDYIDPGLNFESTMLGRQTSAYLRVPFTLNGLEALLEEGTPALRMRYDDGFVAYLNGVKILSVNAPRNPRWNSVATDSHEASGAMDSFPIEKHAKLLREGRNLIAVQAMNISAGSSDFLLTAGLQLESKAKLEALAAHVDMDSFFKFWAVEGLLGFWDGYSGNRNNYFVYHNPATDKMHFMPWGADSLFTNESMVRDTRGKPKAVKTKGAVAAYLFRIPSQRKRYGETISRILDEHWNEAEMLAEMDRLSRMLQPYVNSEQSRFQWRLADMKRFVQGRRTEVLREVNNDFQVNP